MGRFLSHCLIAITWLLFPIGLLAHEAPISDLSSEQSRFLSSKEEMDTLKRQLSHLLEMNFPGKIEALQQEIQTLRGTLEKQAHDIQTLQTQLKPTTETSPDQITHPKLVEQDQDKPLPKKTEPISNYEKAIEAIRHKKYPEAQDLLIQYLSMYPKDKLAGNAHFWLGEVYYQRNKKYLAKREFEIVRKQYPTNAKAPNALLKIGYIEIDEENFGKAKTTFKEVIETFPNTPSAHLAKIKLDKLTKK